MGWTYQPSKFHKNGKVDRKAECDAICTWEDANVFMKPIRSTMKGTTYYAAVETIHKKDGSREVWAAVILTSIARNDYYDFGYKEMSETCGPCERDCPKAIIRLLTPTDSQWANEWREDCLKKTTKNKPSLSTVKVGETIEFIFNGKLTRATKMAPAYQFKRPWYLIVDTHQYIRPCYITDWKVVTE